MSSEKKPFGTIKNGMTTGGLGAFLSLFIPALVPDAESPWRTICYAAVPGISAAITYFMVWVTSRYGLETPAEASLRARCNRDLKNIDKQLASPHLSDSFKVTLISDREKIVRKLVNIGSLLLVKDATAQPEE